MTTSEQTNLTPEQYKTLAEFAGLNAFIHRNTGDVFISYKDTVLEEKYGPLSQAYTPDTNDSQAWELEDKVIIAGHAIEWSAHPGILANHSKELHLIAIDEDGNVVFDEGGDNRKLLLCHAVLAIGGEG